MICGATQTAVHQSTVSMSEFVAQTMRDRFFQLQGLSFYRFVAINVGSYGREGDAGIFLKSNIRTQINNSNFNIPLPRSVPGTTVIQPHVILGDEAFSPTTTTMKPYPQNQTIQDKTKAALENDLSPSASVTGRVKYIRRDVKRLGNTDSNLLEYV
ncbi:hypothetical protein ILUMI_15931 [Ignelater luminosus]|uniref:DDE Tnp4 domain-containing protein n=1 Tax=Ignelater luminosus TaxID=2038154 RepID=A0A8K0CMP4_IGNLU|nr:hypothetical protein ILUMI_15931 [Ignelater luminosus]